MAMTEEQAFRRAVEGICRGATGYAAYNDLYEPIWVVRFSNGHLIEGKDKHDVARQTDTYAQGVKRLTGEYP